MVARVCGKRLTVICYITCWLLNVFMYICALRFFHVATTHLTILTQQQKHILRLRQYHRSSVKCHLQSLSLHSPVGLMIVRVRVAKAQLYSQPLFIALYGIIAYSQRSTTNITLSR